MLARSVPERTDALGRTVAALHPAFELPLERADPSCSRVEGLRPLQVLHSPPTRELNFTILAFDAMHAPLHTGGDAFSVAIRGPAPVWPSLTDNQDGTYAIQVALLMRATVRLHVNMDKEMGQAGELPPIQLNFVKGAK